MHDEQKQINLATHVALCDWSQKAITKCGIILQKCVYLPIVIALHRVIKQDEIFVFIVLSHFL